jgi:hypothetical protein
VSRSLIEDVLPLSPLQEGLLFHAEFDDEGPDVYLVQALIDLDGPQDPAVLRDACARLLNRHDALRASFHFRGLSHPVQVIRRSVPLPWNELDVSALDEPEQQAGMRRFLDADRMSRFDLTRPPLRFTALDLGGGRRRLVFSHHHILLDGWSLSILVNDLVALCADRGPLPPVPRYREYQAWLAGRDRTADRKAWARALEAVPEPTALAPADWRAETSAMPAGVQFELSPGSSAAVAAQARSRSLTLHSVAGALWGILLGQLTGRDETVFGTVVAGRPPEIPGIDRMAGLFANSVPLRVRWSEHDSVRAVAACVQDDHAAMSGHQHVSLGEIQRAAGHRHLFDTFIELENYPGLRDQADHTDSAGHAATVRVTGLRIIDAAHYPLGVLLSPGPPLRVRIEYQEAAFDRGLAEEIGWHLMALFEKFGDQPDAAIGPLCAESPEDIRATLTV